MRERTKNRTAFRPCARHAVLEGRLVLSSIAAGAIAAAVVRPAQVGAVASTGPVSIDTASGASGNDVLSIGTGAVTGASSQGSPSLAFTPFQAVSDLASDPQYALNIPGTTPVNLPTGPLPGVLGTPESVIGYWGYNDDFGNGYYQNVSSSMDSTPFFANPNEGFHWLSKTPASPSSATAAPTQVASNGISPEALLLSLGNPASGGAGTLISSHGNVGNQAVRKNVPGREGLQELSPRFGGAGTVDLVTSPPPAGSKGPAVPARGPVKKAPTPAPQENGRTRFAPPSQEGTKVIPKGPIPIGPEPPVDDGSRKGPPIEDDSRGVPIDKEVEAGRLEISQNAGGSRIAGERVAGRGGRVRTIGRREPQPGAAPAIS